MDKRKSVKYCNLQYLTDYLFKMSYPNVLNYTSTNKITIQDVRETCQEESDVLQQNIIDAINEVTKNFLKPFSNTDYGIFLQSNKTWDMGTNNNNGIVGTKTNTSFNYAKYEGGTSQTTQYMWYACGY